MTPEMLSVPDKSNEMLNFSPVLKASAKVQTLRRNCVFSACEMKCHKKCEKHMPNLCGVDQKQMAQMLLSLRREKSMSTMQRQGNMQNMQGF